MFCCTLLHVPSSFAIILVGKIELVVLLSLSSWCLVIVVWLFLAVPWVCLQFLIVVFSDHTYLLFLVNLTFSAARQRLNMFPQNYSLLDTHVVGFLFTGYFFSSVTRD